MPMAMKPRPAISLSGIIERYFSAATPSATAMAVERTRAAAAAPEGADVASAPYPKLADTPPAAPAGVYTAAAPDPAKGDAALIELAAEAETSDRRRKAVEGPVE